MQTALADHIRNTPEGLEAEDILRRCVHCGFCTATCPTYQLLGNELDSPRGRIYLIKQVLEGEAVTAKTQLHLDRCLTCRNCESTCPSGVEYGKLIDIGRKIVDEHVPRPFAQRALRHALKEGMTSPLFAPAMKIGQLFRPVLPHALRNKVPARQPGGIIPTRHHARKIIMLQGCVQPAMQPNINAATARVLDALSIESISPASAGCCGAVRYHLNDHDGGLDDMRRNIDVWWPLVEAGAESIVINASGCGVMIKEYGHKLRNDPAYVAKAARISALARDLSETLAPYAEELAKKIRPQSDVTAPLAYHPPCTLQHGQKIRGTVEGLMRSLGFDIRLPADSHLCCGSAGTYSVLQAELSYKLRDNKLAALNASGPAAICSANIGCITHLQSGSGVPVRHWIEMIDALLS